MSALKPVTKREGPIDQTLLTVVAVLLGAGLVLWLTGQVGGYLHSRTWPRPAWPAAAWSTSSRASSPAGPCC
jgi:hypothetical protein